MTKKPPKRFDDEAFKEIIVDRLGVGPEEVIPKASFVDDLGADSLDTVELVMAFEEEYDIEIPDEDAEKFMRTVGGFRNYVLKRLGNPEKWANHPLAKTYSGIDDRTKRMVLQVLGNRVNRKDLTKNPITEDTNIYKRFGADFWDTIELLKLFDKRFKIEGFPETEGELGRYAVQKINLGQMCNYLRSRVGPRVLRDLYGLKSLKPGELPAAVESIFGVDADYMFRENTGRDGYRKTAGYLRKELGWTRVKMPM